MTVESSSIKASEGLFGDNQLDPENPVSTENKKKFRRLTQIIRVYYVLGPAANEQIGKDVTLERTETFSESIEVNLSYAIYNDVSLITMKAEAKWAT